MKEPRVLGYAGEGRSLGLPSGSGGRCVCWALEASKEPGVVRETMENARERKTEMKPREVSWGGGRVGPPSLRLSLFRGIQVEAG